MRWPRLTLVSDGKPLRRLLVRSKAGHFLEVVLYFRVLCFHDSTSARIYDFNILIRKRAGRKFNTSNYYARHTPESPTNIRAKAARAGR